MEKVFVRREGEREREKEVIMNKSRDYSTKRSYSTYSC